MSEQSNLAYLKETPSSAIKNSSILDRVQNPSDIKHLSDSEIAQLADEVRTELIETCSKTGGHLGSGLGVVELTTAIHAVFNTPDDKLIFDVGHQCYPHKILTNRREHMP